MANPDFKNIRELSNDTFRCVRCGNCMDVVDHTNDVENICPVGTLHPDGSWEHFYARGRLQNVQGYLEDCLPFDESHIDDIFCDPLCSSCETHCVVNHYYMSGAHPKPAVPVMDIFEALRRDIYESYPKHRVFTEIRGYHKAQDNTEGLRQFQSDNDIPLEGKTMYFAGCNGPCRADSVWEAGCRVLKAAGVEFAMQPGAGTCCGYVYLRNGMNDMAEKLARQHLKKVQEGGVEEIITSCACCHRTLKIEYPKLLGDEWTPRVTHITELAAEALEDGRLKPEKPVNAAVGYHDPCNLTKPLNLYDSEIPRNILDKIPGVELREIHPARGNAFCCGAGGGMRATFPEVAGAIGADKVKRASSTGVGIIASACPFCEDNLAESVSAENGSLRVMDIIEIIDESTGGKK